MNQIRRNILLGAGGALGGAALAAPAALAATREVILLSTYVAGSAYYQAGEVAAALRPGDPLTLRGERHNDYDPRAIEIRTPFGTKLGYVPRVDNQPLGSLMDAGFQVTARVREVLPDGRQPDIRLEVFLTP